MRAAQQLVNGLALGLPLYVPESHLDRAHGVDAGTAATVHAGADIHALPQVFDAERIGTDKDVTQ